tara:strand:- start:2560 stop:2955 length:396 start_codon:yes stop_codon:yes gene_type:complete
MTTKIYIPRILGNVSNNEIIEQFHYMNIGKITYIDTHKKINENGYPYYFAFIQIQYYETKPANYFQDNLEQLNKFQLFYDEEAGNYWEIKKHISRKERQNCVGLLNLWEQDKNNMILEYEELQKEIFSLVL